MCPCFVFLESVVLPEDAAGANIPDGVVVAFFLFGGRGLQFGRSGLTQNIEVVDVNGTLMHNEAQREWESRLGEEQYDPEKVRRCILTFYVAKNQHPSPVLVPVLVPVGPCTAVCV